MSILGGTLRVKPTVGEAAISVAVLVAVITTVAASLCYRPGGLSALYVGTGG